MRGMSERGMAIVFVTHDATQADRIADRTLLLEHGKLLERDSGARSVADGSEG